VRYARKTNPEEVTGKAVVQVQSQSYGEQSLVALLSQEQAHTSSGQGIMLILHFKEQTGILHDFL